MNQGNSIPTNMTQAEAESILITCRFHICKLAYLPNVCVIAGINARGALPSLLSTALGRGEELASGAPPSGSHPRDTAFWFQLRWSPQCPFRVQVVLHLSHYHCCAGDCGNPNQSSPGAQGQAAIRRCKGRDAAVLLYALRRRAFLYPGQ